MQSRSQPLFIPTLLIYFYFMLLISKWPIRYDNGYKYTMTGVDPPQNLDIGETLIEEATDGLVTKQ